MRNNGTLKLDLVEVGEWGRFQMFLPGKICKTSCLVEYESERLRGVMGHSQISNLGRWVKRGTSH